MWVILWVIRAHRAKLGYLDLYQVIRIIIIIPVMWINRSRRLWILRAQKCIRVFEDLLFFFFLNHYYFMKISKTTTITMKYCEFMSSCVSGKLLGQRRGELCTGKNNLRVKDKCLSESMTANRSIIIHPCCSVRLLASNRSF